MASHRSFALGLAALSLGVAAFVACSSSSDPPPASTSDAGSSGEAGASSSSSSSSSSSGSSGKDAGDPPLSPDGVQINEIAAKGEEWVELFNGTTDTKDLSGWTVADEDKDGGPKLAESVKLPPGTTLGPSTYVVVVGGAKADDAGVVVTDAGDGGDAGLPPCPGPAGTRCFYASFGVSAKNGEHIYLLRPDQTLSAEAVLPANAVNAAGETWSRIPNGTGKFALGVATPAAANVAK